MSQNWSLKNSLEVTSDQSWRSFQFCYCIKSELLNSQQPSARRSLISPRIFVQSWNVNESKLSSSFVPLIPSVQFWHHQKVLWKWILSDSTAWTGRTEQEHRLETQFQMSVLCSAAPHSHASQCPHASLSVLQENQGVLKGADWIRTD